MRPQWADDTLKQADHLLGPDSVTAMFVLYENNGLDLFSESMGIEEGRSFVLMSIVTLVS
jgi:hypothetical protein